MALSTQDIAEHLEDKGFGTVGVDIFAERQPPKPNAVISVMSAGGQPSEGAFGSKGIAREYPAIQVLVRGEVNDALGPRQVMERIYLELTKIETQLVNGTFWHTVGAQHPPFPLTENDAGRVVMTCTFTCDKEPGV